MSSATTVEEALWLEAAGVDAIIAQGYEGRRTSGNVPRRKPQQQCTGLRDNLAECERLRNLINRGPGKDPSALREALHLADALRQAAAPYRGSRLTAISEQLRRLPRLGFIHVG
jgi:hypothetical protein